MNLSWDSAKEAANLSKHGVDFDVAVEVFDDPLCHIEQDRVVDGEQRWHAIGSAFPELILLVEADDELEIRIISARKVTRHERKRYESRTH